MATLSSNGGVERYWRSSTRDRSRLALCRNGQDAEAAGARRAMAVHGPAPPGRRARSGLAQRDGIRSQRRRHPHDTRSAAP